MWYPPCDLNDLNYIIVTTDRVVVFPFASDQEAREKEDEEKGQR